MKLSSRLYIPHDYELYAAWSATWGWGQLPREALPTSGIVVEGSKGPVCMGFLYTTNSSMAWLDWIMSNPASAKIERDQALDITANNMKLVAYELV